MTEDEEPKQSDEESLQKNQAEDVSQRDGSVAGSPEDTTETSASGEDYVKGDLVEAGDPPKVEVTTEPEKTEDNPEQHSKEDVTTTQQIDIQKNDTTLEIVTNKQNEERNRTSEVSDKGQSDLSAVDNGVGSEEVGQVEDSTHDDLEESARKFNKLAIRCV
uniref:Uncharacterized protein n=1 Tax=Branchiostoma floridae TaxID=7739 RepID=C3Z5E6_BRAFL|eukprot:XP_002596047.1 hypothetical protein BRAFLDRAFT_66223 [Branchiostoma floridae]